MLTKTEDESNTLFSDRYQQTYHSTFGAQTESTMVFLEGAGVKKRLIEKHHTRVLEIGFGLGLNCLLCADCAELNQASLEYTSVEHSPINEAEFTELAFGSLLKEPSLANDLQQLIANVQRPSSDSDPIAASAMLGQFVNVTLHIDDASSAELMRKLQLGQPYDAIFLDAFSPDVNPECWTPTFFNHLAKLLTPDGRLATYCVKGSVRRNLADAGFRVHKYPGPKGKREVLWASLATRHNA